MKRYRLIEFDLLDELYFSNGVQSGFMVVGVDTVVGDEGVCFRKADVSGVRLELQIGTKLVPMSGHVGELVADWLDTPGNLQLLAARVDAAEERDPTFTRAS